MNTNYIKISLYRLKEWLKAISIALCIFILIRSFVVDIAKVESTSMNRTLFEGDLVTINKLAYGPRFPITPLSIPFTHQFIPFFDNRKSYADVLSFDYFRIGGSPNANYNDIVIFNYPYDTEHPIDHKTIFAKRLVGLPGDSLEIINGDIYVSDVALEKPQTSQRDYEISVKEKSQSFNWEYLDSLGITEGGKISTHKNIWSLSLTSEQLNLIKQHKDVIRSKAFINQIASSTTFPYSGQLNWNEDNFGPLYIPKAGDQVELNKNSINFYLQIISQFEKNDVFVDDSIIYINGNVKTNYQIQSNYYFVVGDNWHNSSDSRHWGFLPESHIIGKMGFKFYSSNN